MNKNLINMAIEMCMKSYAPFSNYHVGAAIETQCGKIIGGCNVESSSYGLTCCAERIALFRAISEGYTNFVSMAVATKNSVLPCGACRQVIWELCNDIPIYICNMNGYEKTVLTSEILPDAFDKTKLK